MKMFKPGIGFVLMGICLATNVNADTNDSAIKVKWGYTGNLGPGFWGQLDPSFAGCSKGQSQSPINIPKKTMKAANALTVNYQPAPMMIVDDGNTVLALGNAQMMINEGHSIQLNFPDNQIGESITFDGKKYRLIEFHMHTPSETQWRNQGSPLEIHFVHQGDNGQAAVVAVLVKAGEKNSTIQKIIDNLPNDRDKTHTISNLQIDPSTLLPAKQDYYSFMGSLTTPPCTEGLQWIVMANSITASPAQIMKLRKQMGANARPVQKLNGRQISYSEKGE